MPNSTNSNGCCAEMLLWLLAAALALWILVT